MMAGRADRHVLGGLILIEGLIISAIGVEDAPAEETGEPPCVSRVLDLAGFDDFS